MADKTYPGLPEAVEQSLRRGGPALLSNPQRLLAFLADAMHPESMELRVLLRCCDDEMLAPFARADQMSTSELQMAGSRMQAYLTDECMVDARSAATVAGGFVVGVARWRGFAPAQNVQRQVPPQRRQGYQPQQQQVQPRQQQAYQVQQGQPQRQQVQPPQQLRIQPQQRVQPQQQVQPQPQPQQQVQQNQLPVNTTMTPKKKGFPIWVIPVAAVAVLVVAGLVFFRPWERVLGGRRSPKSEGTWLMTSYEKVNADGDPMDSTTYTFDEHGNVLTSESIYHSDGGGVSDNSYVYSGYDEYGRYDSYTYKYDYKSDSYESKSEDTYELELEVDDEGRIQKKTKTGTSKYYSSYSEEWTTDDEGTEVTTYEYEDGNCVRQESRRVDSETGNLESEDVSDYDEYGHLTHNKWTSYDDDGEVSYEYEYKATYELDDEGKILSSKSTTSSVSGDDETTTKAEYEYDEHENVVKSVQTDSAGEETTVTTEITYDSHDNPIKRVNSDGSVETLEWKYIEKPSPCAARDLVK